MTDQLIDLKTSAGRLHSENLKLVEKVRFFESTTSPTTVYKMANNNHAATSNSDLVDAELGDVLPKYQPIYESQFDPFKLFFRSVRFS